MSDTLRTDAARHDEHDPYMAIAAECSKLERELNAANKTIRLQHELMTTAEKRGVDKAKEELNEANERIKRLEEAGSELRECASRIGTVASGEGSVIRRTQEAIQAWDKEGNP